MPRIQDPVRFLLAEQAALRRVATLVAQGADRTRVFDVVSEEVGRLLDAQISTVVRYEDDGVASVLGGWNASGVPTVPVGSTVPLDGETVPARIYRSGRPERLDGYVGLDERPTELHRQGFRVAVGAPITLGGELWGAVLAASSAPEPFPEGAEDVLATLAELVAQALANAEAREQLEASRQRIVEAADGERRRLERDLHDGAQQRLITVSLMLRIAEREVDRAPASAHIHLKTALRELEHAHAELRELARGLHPVVLTDRGLAPALHALADRSPVPVSLDLRLDDRPEVNLEVATYHVVSESLANVAKYAQASAATVVVRRAHGSVVVEVADDGRGGADPAGGCGLRLLADRVEALGGRLTVDSSPGAGTTVRAELPEH